MSDLEAMVKTLIQAKVPENSRLTQAGVCFSKITYTGPRRIDFREARVETERTVITLQFNGSRFFPYWFYI